MQNEIRERQQSSKRGIGASRGPGGSCMCPSCDYKEIHQPGLPCNTKQCPRCGTRMVRE